MIVKKEKKEKEKKRKRAIVKENGVMTARRKKRRKKRWWDLRPGPADNNASSDNNREITWQKHTSTIARIMFYARKRAMDLIR